MRWWPLALTEEIQINKAWSSFSVDSKNGNSNASRCVWVTWVLTLEIEGYLHNKTFVEINLEMRTKNLINVYIH